MPSVRKLSHDEILELHGAILSARLSSSCAGLLAGVDPAFVASLPKAVAHSEQVLADLVAVSEAGTLTDGTVPLTIWLRNAIALAQPRQEALTFKRLLATVEVQSGSHNEAVETKDRTLEYEAGPESFMAEIRLDDQWQIVGGPTELELVLQELSLESKIQNRRGLIRIRSDEQGALERALGQLTTDRRRERIQLREKLHWAEIRVDKIQRGINLLRPSLWSDVQNVAMLRLVHRFAPQDCLSAESRYKTLEAYLPDIYCQIYRVQIPVCYRVSSSCMIGCT